MSLDNLISTSVPLMPSNPLLKEHKNHESVQHLFSRDDVNVQDLLPDNLGYEKLLGAASWKEAHLVYSAIGEMKMPLVLKFINETNFAKTFRASEGKDKQELIIKELLGGNPNSLEGLAYAMPIKLKDGSHGMLEEFLPSSVEDFTPYVNSKLALDDLIGFAKGLRSLHVNLNRTWGDAKPEHFRFNVEKPKSNSYSVNDVKRIPKLNDFGSASKGSWSEDGRTATGDFLYRAPETFKKPSYGSFHPDKQHDIFSFGAVAYFMMTGEHLHKDLLDSVSIENNPLGSFQAYGEYMKSVDDKSLKKYYANKLKKVPSKLRDVVSGMLHINSFGYGKKTNWLGDRNYRFQDGAELVNVLEETKRHLDVKKYLGDTLRKSWRALVLSAVVTAGIVGVTYVDRTFEPKEFSS